MDVLRASEGSSMEQLTVQLQNAAYPVYIGSGLLAQAGALLRSASSEGDKLIFTAFGAGFAWGAIYVKWGYDGKG